MKRVKSDWRCRLASSTLSNLLMVLLESEPIETFDPVNAANLWAEDRVRRPAYQRNKSEKATHLLVSDDNLMDIDPPCSLSYDFSSGDEDGCECDVYTSGSNASDEDDE